MYTLGIITISDKGAAGQREDKSGPKIKELLPKDKYDVVSYKIIPDERKQIADELVRLCDDVKCLCGQNRCRDGGHDRGQCSTSYPI